MKLKNKKKDFLCILGANLLGNILAGKGAIARSNSKETKSKRQGSGMNRAGEGIVRAGYGNKKGPGFVRIGHENKCRLIL